MTPHQDSQGRWRDDSGRFIPAPSRESLGDDRARVFDKYIIASIIFLIILSMVIVYFAFDSGV